MTDSVSAWVVLIGVITATVLLDFIVHRTVEGSIYWDDVGGGPVIATIGGREVAIGRTRNMGTDDNLFIVAFDSTTLAELWKAGPYGTYMEGYHSTDWVVSGSHVVVTDFHAKVHILDLTTGKEQHVVSLTDKVDRICSVDPDHVAIVQIDKRTVLLDLVSQTAHEAPLPALCGGPPDMEALSRQRAAVAAIPSFAPSSDFIEATFKASSTLVVLGNKTPGTPTPMVVGLDPTTESIRWHVLLAGTNQSGVRDGSASYRNATVCGDRFIATYGADPKS
ncbi:MAG: hypothetical protein ABI551_19715, partial [Polyangiaceae bacterium]